MNKENKKKHIESKVSSYLRLCEVQEIPTQTSGCQSMRGPH